MLIVGLGNPGPTYEKTRHNIGFMVVDALIQRKKAHKIDAPVLGELYKFQNHFLLKPSTFMNLSGDSIAAVLKLYEIEKSDIVIIHDDLDLPFGSLRFKLGGRDGGHRGLRSINALPCKDYLRVRMGISHPERNEEVSSYVLDEFNHNEKKHLLKYLRHTVEAVEFLLENTLENTSSKFTIKK